MAEGTRGGGRGRKRVEGRWAARWRTEFPYRWDADELVSRRELFHLTVYASGALFSVTALLAVLGQIRRRLDLQPKLIARADQVPEGGVLYFRYPGEEDQAMLLHLPGGRFVAYSQVCTHLSCAVYFQKEQRRIFCPCHDGVFDLATGTPTAGPPQRPLQRILLRQEGSRIFAVGREA